MGTQKRIADLLGVSPACVSQWNRGVRKVPPRLCRAIEQFTKGAVTREELRPDIYGEPCYPNKNIQPTGSVSENPEGKTE
ncbi:helix-turn-helix domain-containing protein [Microbulbifer sp. OS29]|uniref:Helix-turn-helix domain-containing protein n=2 Tax=Microbulbifer okhotskensis TaxID=2926617 RepID=A0A9X2EST0_9GAMM|nr:helix-turn-helix domain-containing protein [Microbulbifer okhotskensis]